MEQDLASWQPEGGLPRIDYSRAVMEELRVYAEEGFQKIPHGGIEVGAVLLGEHTADSVRVLEWRPMACDHARGPGFALSDHDREALRAQLARCGSADELRGLTIVGWCHTHTRSKIFLSDEDLQIHNEFFSEPWQIALVMRPQKDQPPLAGFFCRDGSGVMAAEASALEFTVTPDISQSLKPRRPSAASPEASRLTSGRPDALSSSRPGNGGRQGRPMFREQSSPQQHQRVPLPEETSGERRLFASAGTAGTATAAAPALASPPAPTHQPPSAARDGLAAASLEPAGDSLTATAAFPRPAMWAAIALLVVAAVGTAGYLWTLSQSARTASLKVEESDRSSLMISWDLTSPLVSTADRAMLRIVDGGVERLVPLSSAVVRGGSVTYLREADDVDIRLSLFREDQLTGTESAHFVGSQPVEQTTTAAGRTMSIDDQRLQLQTDVAKLREVLREESNKTARLREELALLEMTAAAAVKPQQPPAAPNARK